MVLVVAVLGIGGAFVLLQGDDGDTETTSGSAPEDTVRTWFQAALDRDCETLIDRTIEGTVSRQEAVAKCEDGIDDLVQSFEGLELLDVKLVSEEGDTAVVETVSTRPGSPEVTERAELRREDDQWRLDPSSFETVG